jgi:hypothetical protein
MGMYTGLRGTITFKPVVAALLQSFDFDWGNLAYYLNSDTVRTFARKGRSGFIPKGALSYMPSHWDEIVNEWIDATTYSFACSLKNYDGEIGAFLATLPIIADEWDLEELYEEADCPEIHKGTSS